MCKHTYALSLIQRESAASPTQFLAVTEGTCLLKLTFSRTCPLDRLDTVILLSGGDRIALEQLINLGEYGMPRHSVRTC